MIWFSIHNCFRERKQLPRCIRYLVKHFVCFIMRIDLKARINVKNVDNSVVDSEPDCIIMERKNINGMKTSDTIDSDWISLNNRLLLNPISGGGKSDTIVKKVDSNCKNKLVTKKIELNNSDIKKFNTKKKINDTKLEFELIAILNKFIFYLFLAFIISLNILLLYLFPYYLKSQLHFQD